ncbi:Hypothetical predicted protein [Paramuricea clavata]|uniref:Uncharacterized protein n=1 Tax=Paramuricea clavata TaxID=317549 RepID=A0A7D9DV52_PARCT|nr:Hypothetical predicted protein [Paramuricea clavata]
MKFKIQLQMRKAYTYSGKNYSCVTLFVGNQGSIKVMCDVRGRSEKTYGWCSEVPGDNACKKLPLREVCKKVMAPGGFIHILHEVFSRWKINAKSFGKRKFQDQTLERI